MQSKIEYQQTMFYIQQFSPAISWLFIVEVYTATKVLIVNMFLRALFNIKN